MFHLKNPKKLSFINDDFHVLWKMFQKNKENLPLASLNRIKCTFFSKITHCRGGPSLTSTEPCPFPRRWNGDYVTLPL